MSSNYNSISGLIGSVATNSSAISALSGSLTTTNASITALNYTLSSEISTIEASLTAMAGSAGGQVLFIEPFYANDSTDSIGANTALPQQILLPDASVLNVITSDANASYQTDTPALRFTGGIQMTFDLTQAPFNLSFKEINTLIAADFRIYFAYDILISRGGGTISSNSALPSSAFRLLLNTSSITDTITGMFVNEPNTSNVEIDRVQKQVDVTAVVSGLSAALLTVYSNISSPSYLDIFSMSLYAVPKDCNVNGVIRNNVFGCLLARVYNESGIYANQSLTVGATLPAAFLTRPLEDIQVSTLSFSNANFGSAKAYSMRICGYIQPPVTGTYLFRTSFQESAQLYVGTEKIVSSWTYSGSVLQAIGTLTMYANLWSPFILQHACASSLSESLLVEVANATQSSYSTLIHGTTSTAFRFE